jgi:hypothetical protein
MTTRFLGKLPFVLDHRDLKLAKYIDAGKLIDLAMAPLGADWSAMPTVTGALPIPSTDPLYNNKAGCCVDTGLANEINMVGQQTGNSSLVVTADMVRKKYIEQTGFDPWSGANDTGLVIRDVLKDAMKNGIFGAKPVAFAAVDWANEQEVALANWLGCGTIGGYALPAASQNQVDEQGRPSWYVPAGGWPSGWGPGTWGGHCIWQHGQRNGNTWGEGVIWTQNWAAECCDELWLVLWSEWKMANGRAPDGFDFEQLKLDVAARQAG